MSGSWIDDAGEAVRRASPMLRLDPDNIPAAAELDAMRRAAGDAGGANDQPSAAAS